METVDSGDITLTSPDRTENSSIQPQTDGTEKSSDSAPNTETDEDGSKSGVKRHSEKEQGRMAERNKRRKLWREMKSTESNPWGGSHVGGQSFNEPKPLWERGKPAEYVVWIKESEVGISKFLGSHKGFDGVLKQRFSDFVVNEKTPEGEIVRITNTAVPEPIVEQDSANLSIIPEEARNRLPGLLDGTVKGSVEIPVDDLSKGERRDLHEAIRAISPKLSSTTVDREGKKFIAVKKTNPNIRERGERQLWPKHLGDYVHFVLYKENIDTMGAILQISEFLRRHQKMFTYAGVKDKRAKTTQRVSVYRIEPEKLNDVNRRLRNVTLGNFSYHDKSIFLGDLSGNHFQIALRNTTGDDAEIEESVKSLQENGFINYFGMQRFGSTSIPTFHIGRAMLKSNWKEVVELILKPRQGGEENLRHIRTMWWNTQDAHRAFKALWNKNTVEGKLLQGLAKYDRNLVSAIHLIPRSMRTMYVHSYQSYIWNTIVSRRIEKFGLEPVLGDLFVRGELPEPSVEVDMELVEDNSDRRRSDEESAQDKKTENKEDQKEEVGEDDSKAADRCWVTPDLVTEENIGGVSIHDVVLPLPGFDTKYPENEVAEWYKEMLDKDGVDMSDKKKNKEYLLPGSYRRLVVKPSDVSWKIVKYNDLNQPLILTDYDHMVRKASTGDDPGTVQSASTGLQEGAMKALLLEFSLPSSSYATMTIREVTKRDTAQLTQSTDNVHQKAWDNRDQEAKEKVPQDAENEDSSSAPQHTEEEDSAAGDKKENGVGVQESVVTPTEVQPMET